MKRFKAKEIELFGLKLFLHERAFCDAVKLNEFWKDPDVSKESLYAGAVSKIEALKDALKLNFDNCYLHFFKRKILIRPFRLRKLKKFISTNYLFKNIGTGKLNELNDIIIFELEGNDKNHKGEEKEVMSTSRMISLVSEFTGISWDEANQLPVSQFIARLDEAVNLATLFAGGKYEMKSGKDRKSDLELEYEMVKEFWDSQDETVN